MTRSGSFDSSDTRVSNSKSFLISSSHVFITYLSLAILEKNRGEQIHKFSLVEFSFSNLVTGLGGTENLDFIWCLHSKAIALGGHRHCVTYHSYNFLWFQLLVVAKSKEKLVKNMFTRFGQV